MPQLLETGLPTVHASFACIMYLDLMAALKSSLARYLTKSTAPARRAAATVRA